ncbi:hypothetical protein SBRCBS47491_009361 [Sporothrix bragantina]|uniref:Uncharacterized protein n=1 Tax=Sporothrix bragantina TaxID=671064 RepID=A0ABP0CVS7_9PEZI
MKMPSSGLLKGQISNLIDENIADPALRLWILPSFSATTLDDEVVAAVIMMSTLQKYFGYVMDCKCCGIPSVTLLGPQSDWEEYGDEPTRFCEMLRPVFRGFVASFTGAPGDAAVVDFWSRMVSRARDSSLNALTGWLAAFCFWHEDGKRLYGDYYASVNYDSVPAGHVSVPVTYISPEDFVTKAKLFAGFVGLKATTAPAEGGPLSAGELASAVAEDVLHTLRTLTGWWMYETNVRNQSRG